MIHLELKRDKSTPVSSIVITVSYTVNRVRYNQEAEICSDIERGVKEKKCAYTVRDV